MPNKIYISRETPIKFVDAGGTITLGLSGLDIDTARISDRYDQGAGSTASDFTIRATVSYANAPILGEVVDIWISTSDGAEEDGQLGIIDANVSDNNLLKNCIFVGSIVLTAITTDQTASFIVRIPTRYFSIIVHNRAVTAGDTLTASTSASFVTVTPIPYEIQ